MKIGGNDLLVQIENESPKLGSFLRRYVMPAIQSRGLVDTSLPLRPMRPGMCSCSPSAAFWRTRIQKAHRISERPPAASWCLLRHQPAASRSLAETYLRDRALVHRLLRLSVSMGRRFRRPSHIWRRTRAGRLLQQQRRGRSQASQTMNRQREGQQSGIWRILQTRRRAFNCSHGYLDLARCFSSKASITHSRVR